MKCIIIFEDNPAADPDMRKTHMLQHLEFLETNAAAIHSAGPLFGAAGEGRGGLWLVEVQDLNAAKALVQKDPFWPTGLRKSFSILEWRQVYADGSRLIFPQ